jgi:FkbM family methyltransferase
MAETIDLSQIIYAIKDPRMEELRNSDGLRFIGHCLAHASVSQSQNYQDVFAATVNEFRPGYFVEFGATNGVDGSNTLLLEKLYQWRGILAEPNPDCTEELKRNRNSDICTDCVYTETGKTMDFAITNEPDLSTLAGYGSDDEHAMKRLNGKIVQVNTITLYDMLKKYDAPSIVDYVSVDTEGSELDILEQFFEQNNDEYKFRCLTVEHNFNNEKREKIKALMNKNGYRRAFMEFSRWDDFYVYAVKL